ncbi:FtsK/SpoIIIE domain-containing protein [Salinifilum aidingensis]
MRKRDERRRRIEQAFARLRASVATALGAAEQEHARRRQDVAREESALRIAQHGVAAAYRDPGAASTGRGPAFDAALRAALEERAEIYRDWQAAPQQLSELVASAAPGAAGAPWSDWLGTPGTAGATEPPELWRIGTASVPDSPAPEPFPAAVPLLDESHLRVTSTAQTRETAEALVQNLLLRVVGHFQPGLVRVHVWDIGQFTGTLPGLYPLTRAELLTAHDPTRLDEMLQVLSDQIRRIHTSALLGGHTSLRSLAAETGHRQEPWRIAVLFGTGEPLQEEQQRQLQRIARNGLACGIQLITVDLPLTVHSPLESVTLLESDRARSSTTGSEAVVRPDESPPHAEVLRACDAIAEAHLARRARVRTFADLAPERTWAQDSTAGLSAPVGFDAGEPVRITLGDASPHMLVGGPSGSGKTNFLFGMLGSLAARYSPDELELYLLDFKEGVSFAQCTPGRREPSWLPHARLVGVNVNTDREFGLALLRFLADEMRRRADAAKEHEVTKLEELRAADPQGRWPRIVAVIDEFQYLFAGRDHVSAQATSLLEDVARRGRSQGIHLVLASQDVSGIEAFWGKPAIFEQFILRVALPKARRVLAEQNNAAMELPRWHAVVNHESGVRYGDEPARVPDATARGTFDRLQRELWEQRAPGSTPPRLFDGSVLPRLSDALPQAPAQAGAEGAPRALLGQVIDVAGTPVSVPLDRSPGRHVAVIGSARVDAVNALGTAVLSLVRAHRPGRARFTFGCFLDDAAPRVRALAAAAAAAGHEVRTAHLDEAASTVTELAQQLDEQTSSTQQPSTQRSSADTHPADARSADAHYVVLFGVDAAHTALERKDQTMTSGMDRLRALLRHGPEARVHVLGWWRSAQRVKHTLGMTGSADDLGAWVAFDAHGQELTQFAAGQVVNWAPRARRGLFFDRSAHARPEVVLPFELDDLLEEAAEPGGASGSAEGSGSPEADDPAGAAGSPEADGASPGAGAAGPDDAGAVLADRGADADGLAGGAR